MNQPAKVANPFRGQLSRENVVHTDRSYPNFFQIHAPSVSKPPPIYYQLQNTDCAKIFANAKQLANFNRQFLLDLRRAYGGPGQWELVSPVFRDSGNWRRINPLRNGHDDPASGTSALSTYTATMDNASKLEDDPFRPSSAIEDVDKGPRQMLEVFLKSAPFLKVRGSSAGNIHLNDGMITLFLLDETPVNLCDRPDSTVLSSGTLVSKGVIISFDLLDHTRACYVGIW